MKTVMNIMTGASMLLLALVCCFPAAALFKGTWDFTLLSLCFAILALTVAAVLVSAVKDGIARWMYAPRNRKGTRDETTAEEYLSILREYADSTLELAKLELEFEKMRLAHYREFKVKYDEATKEDDQEYWNNLTAAYYTDREGQLQAELEDLQASAAQDDWDELRPDWIRCSGPVVFSPAWQAEQETAFNALMSDDALRG